MINANFSWLSVHGSLGAVVQYFVMEGFTFPSFLLKVRSAAARCFRSICRLLRSLSLDSDLRGYLDKNSRFEDFIFPFFAKMYHGAGGRSSGRVLHADDVVAQKRSPRGDDLSLSEGAGAGGSAASILNDELWTYHLQFCRNHLLPESPRFSAATCNAAGLCAAAVLRAAPVEDRKGGSKVEVQWAERIRRDLIGVMEAAGTSDELRRQIGGFLVYFC